ncbi:MAG: ATP-binding cassette domain-containing protein, partial [Lachnospiraceae bacterium]|nr:ATP-binding cassette domain-containing protein [Lachnospiraceae bacterium]
KKHIGYLSGNTKLYNRFSTREMLTILANVYGIGEEETKKRIEVIEEVLNMGSFMDNRIEKLSTGQTQRANIARCLIHSPEIYIFDEPTLGLDIISSDAIVNFMKNEKANGKTVLYSTHYMEEAQYLCDNIFMIYEGKKIAYGTPKELMDLTGTDNLRDTFKELIKKEGGIHE